MYPSPKGTTVVDLAARRRRDEDVIESITLVFGGVHYGTVPVRIPYAAGKPIRLFLSPAADGGPGAQLSGRIDALVTDDESVTPDLEAAR